MPAGSTILHTFDVTATAELTKSPSNNGSITCSVCTALATDLHPPTTPAPPPVEVGAVVVCSHCHDTLARIETCSKEDSQLRRRSSSTCSEDSTQDRESLDGLCEPAYTSIASDVLVDEPLEELLELQSLAAAPIIEELGSTPRALPSRRRTEPSLHIGSPSPRAKTTRSSTTLSSTSKDREYVCNPFIDITRLRLRSRGNHCLYPGATFQGIQKSDRNDYDVTVQIVDVDISSSYLCGYLTIRGLTDDWPEMTTYFDAEVIGAQHGFITGKWGATDSEDLKHWGRFPAFRQMEHEIEGSRMTLPQRERGALFMRWKERFLVPDHRVMDVTGASFAGFYYICIDMDGRTGSVPKHARETLPAATSHRSTSSGPATMSGFYYHANSEPYQELSLIQKSQMPRSTFEFR